MWFDDCVVLGIGGFFLGGCVLVIVFGGVGLRIYFFDNFDLEFFVVWLDLLDWDWMFFSCVSKFGGILEIIL